MLSEQHRYYLKSIALFGLPLPGAMYYARPALDTITGRQDLLVFLRGFFNSYFMCMGVALVLLLMIRGYAVTRRVRDAYDGIVPPDALWPPRVGWYIALLIFPLLPALYFTRPALGAITGLQDVFVFLIRFFLTYLRWAGPSIALIWMIRGWKATEPPLAAHADVQQYSHDEQQIIVPHSARPPRGGWSEWGRR